MPKRTARASCQEDFVAGGDGHDHRRGDCGINHQAAMRAAQRALGAVGREGGCAAAAEAVFFVPGPQMPAGDKQAGGGIGQASEDVEGMIGKALALPGTLLLKGMRGENPSLRGAGQFKRLRPGGHQGTDLGPRGDGGPLVNKKHTPLPEAEKRAGIQRGETRGLNGKAGLTKDHSSALLPLHTTPSSYRVLQRCQCFCLPRPPSCAILSLVEFWKQRGGRRAYCPAEMATFPAMGAFRMPCARLCDGGLYLGV